MSSFICELGTVPCMRALQQTQVHGKEDKAVTSHKSILGKSSMNSWLNIPTANIKPIPCPFLSRKLHCLTYPNPGEDFIQPSLQNMEFLLWVTEIGGNPTSRQGTTLAFHLVLQHKVSQQGPNSFEISKTHQLILFREKQPPPLFCNENI